MSVLADLEYRLGNLAAADLERRLTLPMGIDFSSNDYLGLANHPTLAAAAAAGSAGAPASRLLRGHTAEHAELEARLAEFKGFEAALLFPSGYQANVGLLSALLERGDRVLSDRLNHASLIDGMRLAGCHREIFAHGDAAEVERLLRMPWPGRTFLVTESFFSMDGDLAPLDRYAELAEHHGAALIVDDAHATGLFGDVSGRNRGSGLVEKLGVEDRCLATVSTFGKAFGLGGAFVAAPRLVIDYLVSTCRSFIFSTAMPPLLVRALGAALDLVAAEPQRRSRLFALSDRLRARLRRSGLEVLGGAGPLVPVMIGDAQRALSTAAELQSQGFDVRAVRPPTVPAGTSRLRISVHADHDEEQLDALAAALERLCGSASRQPATARVC